MNTSQLTSDAIKVTKVLRYWTNGVMNPIVTFELWCNALVTFVKSPKDQFTSFAKEESGKLSV